MRQAVAVPQPELLQTTPRRQPGRRCRQGCQYGRQRKLPRHCRALPCTHADVHRPSFDAGLQGVAA
eukprot:361433-Chlamydomonas_euryale.AAC.4